MSISTFGLKVSFFFAFLSALVSYLCGFLAGNEAFHIFKIMSIVFIANFTISFVCFYILKLEIPEISDLIDKFTDISNEKFDVINSMSTDSYKSENVKKAAKKNMKNNKKDDDNYLTVENTQVKNEPELMAKAIKTMLSKDKE